MEHTEQYFQEWIDEVHVNECSVMNHAKDFDKPLNKAWKSLETLFLLKALALVDATTLTGDDTITNVSSLVNKVIIFKYYCYIFLFYEVNQNSK